jgi:hypothetical protein
VRYLLYFALAFSIAACGNHVAENDTPADPRPVPADPQPSVPRAPARAGCGEEPCPDCTVAVQCTRTCGGPAIECGCCGCADGYTPVSNCPPEPACASDADCRVMLNGCDCTCFPRHVQAPPLDDAQWSAICAGQPMRNCGVASPCMNTSARCNPNTRRCELAR